LAVVRLVGLLLTEQSSTLEHVPIDERRIQPLPNRKQLAATTDHDLASGMLGGEQDRLGGRCRKRHR
jgi:hypothetical protein